MYMIHTHTHIHTEANDVLILIGEPVPDLFMNN